MATVAVKCRFCGLTDAVKKHGTDNGGYPRYRSQDCCRTFQLDYTYKCQPCIKEQVVDLAMNNPGIRDTARTLHISINAVVRTLKKLSLRQVTPLPLDNLHIEFLCEVDEQSSFVAK